MYCVAVTGLVGILLEISSKTHYKSLAAPNQLKLIPVELCFLNSMLSNVSI